MTTTRKRTEKRGRLVQYSIDESPVFSQSDWSVGDCRTSRKEIQYDNHRLPAEKEIERNEKDPYPSSLFDHLLPARHTDTLEHTVGTQSIGIGLPLNQHPKRGGKRMTHLFIRRCGMDSETD